MASVSRDANGKKRILFVDGEGERRAIRLGKVSVKIAESVKVKIEALIASQITGTPIDAELAAWLRDLPDTMYERLARVELVEPREKAAEVTLDDLLKRFEENAAVKPATRAAYRQTTGSLREHLDADTPVRSIKPADADRWREAITDSKLAPATIAKRVHVAKSVFKKAIRWGMIDTNPFADLKAGSQSNPDKAFYVTIESIEAILEACPDDQWRAVVAISRFAGLRCPSEVSKLKWGDVNWEKGRLTVRSPKTEGHEGHAVRVVPITPELRPVLLSLFAQAEEGSEAVVPMFSSSGANLRTTLTKIIERAGVKPWPRLFQNMRASCATDWVERFPAHVVAGWLGHSPLIAARHYLQTRDAHFDLATGGAECGALEAQNAAQHQSAMNRTDSSEEPKNPCFAGDSRVDTTKCVSVQSESMGDTGLEPVTSSLSRKRASQLRQSPGRAESAGTDSGRIIPHTPLVSTHSQSSGEFDRTAQKRARPGRQAEARSFPNQKSG
jgi:integrase